MVKLNIVNRIGSKLNDIKFFKHLVPFIVDKFIVHFLYSENFELLNIINIYLKNYTVFLTIYLFKYV